MPLPVITFKAAYGEKTSIVQLTRFGNGMNWDVTIDGYYQATVVFWDGRWDVRPHRSDYFSLEDLQEIEDRITEWEAGNLSTRS